MRNASASWRDTVDTVSRLGGDEFVVVLNGVVDNDEISHIVDSRLVPQVRRAHDIDGAELHVSCGIGIAIFPDDATDVDTLMRHADSAMYQAKSDGRDVASYFTPELNDRAQRRMLLESRLRHAAERGALTLHYQPRVDTRSTRLMGVEALLRWTHPELGSVAPARRSGATGVHQPVGAAVARRPLGRHNAHPAPARSTDAALEDRHR